MRPKSRYTFRRLDTTGRSDYYEVSMPNPSGAWNRLGNREMVVIGRAWRLKDGDKWGYSGVLYGERGRFKTREKAAEQLAVEWESENG